MAQADTHLISPDPIVEMAHRLEQLCTKADWLGEQIMQLAPHANERRKLARAERAAWTERDALRDYILSIPCQTLAGAAVHIMQASSLVDEDLDNGPSLRPQIQRALRSALPVVMRASGLDMAAVGMARYVSDSTDPFPDVSSMREG